MTQYKVRENLDKDSRKELVEFSDVVAHLLFHRGVKSKDDAQVFLSPEYDKGINDPYLLHDMEKAVKRILKAVENKEKICIYSDYDADGIPGAVVLHDLFKKIGYDNFINYGTKYRLGMEIDRIELKKYNSVLKKMTVHKEIK